MLQRSLLGAALLLVGLLFSQCAHHPPVTSPAEVPTEQPPGKVEEQGPYNILSYSVDVRRNGILIEILLREPLHYDWFLTDSDWINLTFDHGRLDPKQMQATQPHAEVIEVVAHQFDSSAQLSFKMSSPVEKYIVTTDPYSPKRVLVMITGSSHGEIPGGGLPVRPTGGQWVVVLDPGHGGRDAGSIGRMKKTIEKSVMLSIAQRTARLFEKNPDFRVYVTRDGDEGLSDQARIRIARQARSNLFISIHSNFSKQPSVHGCKAYYSEDSSAPPQAGVSAEPVTSVEGDPGKANRTAAGNRSARAGRSSADLAHEIMDKITSSIQTPSLGIERRNSALLSSASRVAVRVAAGFMSNPADEALLRKRSYQQRIAEAIYLGAVAYRDKHIHRQLISAEP